MAQHVWNRWWFVVAALIMQLCLGALYSWGVFRGPLETLYGWSKETSIAPYRYSLLFFSIAMIVAGFWQDKKGPKLIGSIGGILLGTGCLLAALIGHTPSGLNFSYGILGGLGIGFAYVTPIATCVKWFPDKRGMVVGLAVMGFGAGSLIFAPLLEFLIGADPTRFAESIPRTFLVMAAVFYVCVIGAAQLYQTPPPGWKPPGWEPSIVTVGGSKQDFTPGEMLRTWQFYALWSLYVLGTAVGLVAIGQASPLIQEIAVEGALLSGAAALGVMSFFNGIGRLSWGSLSDKIGRNLTTVAMYAVYIIACLFLLRTADGFWPVLIGLCMVGFSFGGYLALLPSYTADYYGTKHIGANYGIMFTAYGLTGYLVPGYFARIMDAARESGTLAVGYNQVYFTLAICAISGAVLALVIRKPIHRWTA